MARDHFVDFDAARVPSPCFVVDEAALEDNLRLLQRVQTESGAKVLLALKAFSMFSLAPLVRRYLAGTCASGLFEARLGREEFGGEVHTFCAAYRDADFDAVLALSDHVVFNSMRQWQHFRARALAARATRPGLRFGLRVNPRHSEGATPLYDPCAPGSRLGISVEDFAGADLTGISGLHFHTLCEQDLPPLARTLAAVEAQFAPWLAQMEWVNFGGGHHITRADYQVDALIALIRDFRARRGVAVYLEPGEAVALNAGVLVTEVLDLKRNDLELAILDTSATCHMPDVIEMPYRPRIYGAAAAGELPHSYRLGGQTCLAGDVIGDYSFAAPLRIGQRLLFADMAHYTMVKTNTFNGVPLPAIAVWNSTTDALRLVREFDYRDFRDRLS
ncbi:MAG: carboxynorspermidine decarboxylase [Porticoccaceae bacterium]